MSENQNMETGVRDTKTKPGKLWLWGLAVFQLVAVFLMSCAEIGDMATRICGFAILALCGRMDINAVKKAGYAMPYWWWGLACFLPPIYMVCRVLKTDTALSDRVKRFAPVLVWGVLFIFVTGVLVSSLDQSDPLVVADAYLNAMVEGDLEAVALLTGTDTSDSHAVRYLKRIVDDASMSARINDESIAETALGDVKDDVAEVKVGIMDDSHTIHITSVPLFKKRGKWYLGEKAEE